MFDHGVDFKEPESFGEFQLVYRTGDIVAPQARRTPSRCASRPSTSWTASRSGDDPLTDGATGLRVVRALEAADASLRRRRKTVELPGAGSGRAAAVAPASERRDAYLADLGLSV